MQGVAGGLYSTLLLSASRLQLLGSARLRVVNKFVAIELKVAAHCRKHETQIIYLHREQHS